MRLCIAEQIVFRQLLTYALVVLKKPLCVIPSLTDCHISITISVLVVGLNIVFIPDNIMVE